MNDSNRSEIFIIVNISPQVYQTWGLCMWMQHIFHPFKAHFPTQSIKNKVDAIVCQVNRTLGKTYNERWKGGQMKKMKALHK